MQHGREEDCMDRYETNIVYIDLSKVWNTGENIHWKQSNFFAKCIHVEKSRIQFHVPQFKFQPTAFEFFIFSEAFGSSVSINSEFSEKQLY